MSVSLSKVLRLKPIVSAQGMRVAEEAAFAAGMPIAALMEKAGLMMASWIQQSEEKRASLRRKVLVLAGPGHNGADALVVARELFLRGYKVFLWFPWDRCKDLTAEHFKYALTLGIERVDDFVAFSEAAASDFFIVDGLLGFGWERLVEGVFKDAISWVNAQKERGVDVISLDVPSGLHTDTGKPCGVAVTASVTLCLGVWKQCFAEDAALPYIGTAHLLDIGLEAFVRGSFVYALDNNVCWKNLLPSRLPTTHKYAQGTIYIAAGSERYPGAALLASQAALETGVGVVKLLSPKLVQQLAVSRMPEILCLPHDVSLEEELVRFSGKVCRQLQTTYPAAFLIGPGCFPVDSSQLAFFAESKLPGVFDASVLTQELSPSVFKISRPCSVFTPHEGELLRLFPELSLRLWNAGRLSVVQEVISQLGADSVLVFKGARTLVAASTGEIFVNMVSTPALARAGSGDILGGLLAGFLAQPNSTCLTASMLAVYLHAQAALRVSQKYSLSSLASHRFFEEVSYVLGEFKEC